MNATKTITRTTLQLITGKTQKGEWNLCSTHRCGSVRIYTVNVKPVGCEWKQVGVLCGKQKAEARATECL